VDDALGMEGIAPSKGHGHITILFIAYAHMRLKIRIYACRLFLVWYCCLKLQL